MKQINHQTIDGVVMHSGTFFFGLFDGEDAFASIGRKADGTWVVYPENNAKIKIMPPDGRKKKEKDFQ